MSLSYALSGSGARCGAARGFALSVRAAGSSAGNRSPFMGAMLTGTAGSGAAVSVVVAVAARGAIADFGQQIIYLALHRANLNLGIDQSGGTNDLLHHLR